MGWMRIGGLVLALAAAMAGQAHAATPFNIGPGLAPDVKVDGAGKAHFGWVEQRGGTADSPGQVHYCRIPVGTEACEAKASAGPPEIGNYPYAVDGPVEIFLNPVDGKPRIFTSCYNCYHGGAQTSELIVDAAGTSMVRRMSGAETGGVIGDIRTTGVSAYDPANDILFGTNAYDFLRMPTPDPSDTDGARLSPFPGGSSGRGAAGFVGAGPSQVQVVAYVGSTTTEPGRRLRFLTHVGDGSDVNTAAAWQGGESSIGFANDLSMESTPAGVSLLTTIGYGNQHSPAVEFRRFDAAARTFSAPVTIASAAGTGDKDPGSPDVFQAPNGRFYAAWLDSGRIRYSTSPDGTSWTVPENVANANPAYDVHVAGNGDADKGFVTWDTNYYDDGVVKAAALAPVLPITCPGDPRCPVTPQEPQQPQQPQQPEPPKPQEPQAPPQGTVKKGTLGQLKYTVSAPTACVPAGATIRVSLAVKTTKKKVAKKKRIKLRSLSLWLGAKRIALRKKSPLRAAQDSTGMKAGSVLNYQLRIVYRRGASKKNRLKKIKVPVKIC